MVRLLAVLLLLVSMSFSSAYAQRTKTIVPDLDTEGHKGDMARAAKKKANERFDKFDENGNGVLEKSELETHAPYKAKNIEKYDTDGDGALTWQEFVGHDRWERESSK